MTSAADALTGETPTVGYTPAAVELRALLDTVTEQAVTYDLYAGPGLMFWGHRPEPDGRVGISCLSQWYPAAFTVERITYPSAEHFMMAAFTGLRSDRTGVGMM